MKSPLRVAPSLAPLPTISQILPFLPFLAAIPLLTSCVVGEKGPPAVADELPARDDLDPVADFREDDFVSRSRPAHVELSADGSILFVSLSGTLIEPANEVLALDAETGDLIARIEVGRHPTGMALAPSGTVLYVANQFSNALSVIDVESLEVVGSIPVAYHAVDLAVSADGRHIYVSNRWLDALEVIELSDPRRGEVTKHIPVGTNPRDVVLGPDGLVVVGNLSATCISLVDPVAGVEVDRVYTNSPINGLASDGRYLFTATLGRGDGHPAAGLTNNEGDSYRGDTTASTGFGDINNDIAVFAVAGGKLSQIARYTSDTAEVSTADAVGDYAASEMIVNGALPEQLVVAGNRLFVSMSASDSVSVFDIASDGTLTASAVLHTGLNPFELVVSVDGETVYTADRLGETVSKIDVGSNLRQAFWVGASTLQVPATRYEIGEMLFHSARFSSEAMPSAVFPTGDRAGDKSCNHCHRESLTDGKVWSVGIGLLVPVGGERMPPAARNIRDTEPLFWEGVQTHKDFDLETNEFAPPTDFGCDNEETEHDPASCAAREAFFRAQVGYTFEEVGTELLGEFLIGRPRLLPNPLAQRATGEVAEAIARGRALFTGGATCARCHPGDSSDEPFTTNKNLEAVISPSPFDNGLQFKDEVDGAFNVPSLRGVWDRPRVFFHDGRAKSLRAAILSPGHAALRPGVDGCQKLAEESSEFRGGIVRPVANGRGCNEVNGVRDTHGVTSALSPAEVADLELFVLSIQ